MTLIINNTEIKSRVSLSYFLKKNGIDFLFDNDNILDEWFEINFLSNDIKKIFLEKIAPYKSSDKKKVIKFFQSNDIIESFDKDRYESYMRFIEERPKDKMSEEYFKLRYGEERYLELYTKNKEKQVLTLNNYISKFGEVEGTNKWDSYIEKQKLSTKRGLSYWLKECKGDEDLAKQKLKEFQSSHKEKFFNGKSQEEIDQYNRENSPWRIEYWIKRGYSKEDAETEISRVKKESSMFCKERYLKEGYSESESIKIANDWWTEHCRDNANSTSKESIDLFTPFIEELSKLDGICIYYGDKENGKNEWFLYDLDNSRYYFYDLTVMYKGRKFIIEYNGSAFHPNKERLNESEWKEWKQLFTDKSADEVYNDDSRKRELAIENGFEYLSVWSDCKENTEIVKEFILC